MALVVKDTQDAISAITQLAADNGGYISGSNLYQYDDVPRGSITLRVPAELYQETLASLRAMAIRVERESSNSQDVTEEYTDLQARKTNLEYTEAALQELLEERRRTGNTSDILEVYRELTNIRGQIEQIEGRLRYLTNQAALSTITVELIPDVLYQPVSVAGWEPQGEAKQALQSLVAALQGFVNLGIWLVIFVLPILVILLIPVVVVVWIIRWWWKRRQAKKQAKQAPEKAEKTE
jgi:Flp pilus assembly protein TadB